MSGDCLRDLRTAEHDVLQLDAPYNRTGAQNGFLFALRSRTTLTVILATITLSFDKVDAEVDMVAYIRPSG